MKISRMASKPRNSQNLCPSKICMHTVDPPRQRNVSYIHDTVHGIWPTIVSAVFVAAAYSYLQFQSLKLLLYSKSRYLGMWYPQSQLFKSNIYMHFQLKLTSSHVTLVMIQHYFFEGLNFRTCICMIDKFHNFSRHIMIFVRYRV